MNNIISFDFGGINIKGEILDKSPYNVDVRLIEPVESWVAGTSVPSFARSQVNFGGIRGDEEIKTLLVELYLKTKKIQQQKNRIRILFLDYVEEIELIKKNLSKDDIKNNKVFERLENKLSDFFMDSVYGDGGWCISDKFGLINFLYKNNYGKDI